MWLQRLTSYLLQHRWQSLVLTFALTFVPIVGGTISIIIASSITLCRGIKEGAIFTLAATVPYVISFFITNPQNVPPIAIWMVLGVAIASNILTWAFAVMLNRHANFSAVVQAAALFGVLVVSVAHLAYPDIVHWWGVQLQAYAEQAQKVTAMVKPSGVAALAENRHEWIAIVKTYATGFIVAIVLVNSLVQLIVARWWQASIYHPGGLQKELHQIRLSRLAGALFVLSLVLSYLGNGVVLDIMPILYVLFGAAGLSLIHYLFRLMHSPSRWFWLTLLYVTLFYAMPITLMLISLLALFDIWFDLRKRLKKA